MNIKSKLLTIAICASLSCLADTSIDPNSPYGYGANIGWINAYADGTNGAIIGQSYCSGYIYGANVGWIHLGNGSPANNIQYGNASNTDYGINHDGIGNLSGFAYGANIGWINFEQTQGKPNVDLTTGELSGFAWGANVGWINLEGITTYSFANGVDSDSDGLSDADEFNIHGTAPLTADTDADGEPDGTEYAMGFDPNNPSSKLDFMGWSANDSYELGFMTVTGKFFVIESRDSLTHGDWIERIGLYGSGTQMILVDPYMTTNRFYRIKVE
jgi:hypothetical protein